MPSSIRSCAAVFAHPQRPARAVFDVGEVGDGLLHRARRDEADATPARPPAGAARPRARGGRTSGGSRRAPPRAWRRRRRAPVPSGGPPAFATRTCRAPKRSTVASTRRPWRVGVRHVVRAARGRRSPAPPPSTRTRSGSRELIATYAPSSASAAADARPRPFDAAVTSATFPASPRSMASDATLPRGVIGIPRTRRSSSSCASRWRRGCAAADPRTPTSSSAGLAARALGPARGRGDRGRSARNASRSEARARRFAMHRPRARRDVGAADRGDAGRRRGATSPGRSPAPPSKVGRCCSRARSSSSPGS